MDINSQIITFKEPLPPKIIAANPFEWLGNTIDAGKRKVLEAVASIVKKIPGYQVLVLILGKDPSNYRPGS